MLILNYLHLNDHTHLSPDSVERVKDREPTVQGVGGSTVSKGVERNVDLANGIVSRVCVVVHQPGTREGGRDRGRERGGGGRERERKRERERERERERGGGRKGREDESKQSTERGK